MNTQLSPPAHHLSQKSGRGLLSVTQPVFHNLWASVSPFSYSWSECRSILIFTWHYWVLKGSCPWSRGCSIMPNNNSAISDTSEKLIARLFIQIRKQFRIALNCLATRQRKTGTKERHECLFFLFIINLPAYFPKQKRVYSITDFAICCMRGFHSMAVQIAHLEC